MLCESSLQPNNKFNPWIKQQPIIIKKATKTRSTHQSSSGTKTRTRTLSFKTSGSPEAKGIAPDKNHDVTMDNANEAAVAANQNEGSAAAAKGGIESSSVDETSKGNKDVDMEDIGNKNGNKGDSAAKASENPMDKLMKAVDMKVDAMYESVIDGGVKKIAAYKQIKSDESLAKGESKKSAGGAKNNNGTDLETTTTKKGKAGENSEKEPETPDDNFPLLVGTLAFSNRENLRRHIIRGNWKYEKSHAAAPQRFELIRTIPPEESLEKLPQDGVFNGSFNVQLAVKNSKGKIKMKNRAVAESGVKLMFTPSVVGHHPERTYAVRGTGTNEYGVFELFGTATKNIGEEDLTYGVSVRKKYVSEAPVMPKAPPAPKPKKEGKKDKKRKHAEATTNDEDEKPPPTELPADGICLRGKLARNTSDELSLDNATVHRIIGVWAMGLSKVLEEATVCERFEYEHKCSGDSTAFPLSGRYTGHFYVFEAGVRTKCPERDVILKFRLNSGGYHNVEGRGSNIYGKYNITGTLMKDGTITLFRHFQVAKVTGSNKSMQVKISAPVTSSNRSGKLPSKSKSTTAVGASLLLTLDDVSAPDGIEPVAPLSPPEQFTATMRGILKIENDGTHTCSGSWAMTNDHFQTGITSKFHFGIESHYAANDARLMLEQIKSSDLAEDDDRQIKNLTSDGVSPVTLANSTFPIDSALYKGSFKLRKGVSRTQTIVDEQIVLKFVKNTGGSYNVYGKGTNETGTFECVGSLILQGQSNGLMQLYRMYPSTPGPLPLVPTASRKSSKVFSGSLTEKAVNSGPVPAMKAPEPFTASTSGLLRRESSRVGRLPTRLEEDDPQAQMDRLMDKCRQILLELYTGDVQKIFSVPVDPIALGVPTYPDVITNPMDLGTIQIKMDHNEIDSPGEFARLVRLTFENAIAFNTLPDNPFHVVARSMLVLFNKKFGSIDKAFNTAKKNKKLTKADRQELKRKEKEAAKEAKKKEKTENARKRKAEVEASNESKRMKLENVIAANKSSMAAIAQAAPKDANANMTRREYNLLVQAIQQVQDQIVGLHKIVKKSSKSNTVAAALYSSDVDKVKPDVPSANEDPSFPVESGLISQPLKPKKKKPKKEPTPSPPLSPKTFPTQPQGQDLQPLSFIEQEALSEAINLLPERLLPGAMQIIREADFVNDDDDEIDLDIDQLDTKTQRKLQSFVMENVKTRKPRKKTGKKPKPTQAAPACASPPSPPPPSAEEDTKLSASPRLPGGKSFFALDPDDDSDYDKDDEEEDLKDDFTNWGSIVANPSTGGAPEIKEGGDDSDKDEGDELWGEARKKAEADKALEADKAKREEKLRVEAELAAQRRMAEAAALGEQARAKREEKEAVKARLQEEQEREAKEAREAARQKAVQEVNSVKTTVDIGDAQRDLMRQYEEEFNDNYSAGASPSSDFGF